MLTGWHKTILSYNFKVEYRPGVMNVLPDHLSRLFPAFMHRRDLDKDNHIVMAYMHVLQNKDTSVRVIEDPKEQEDILHKTHSFGHPGTNAMVRAIHSEQVTWPYLTDDCQNWIKKCVECQKYNIAATD
jgi:hypothetical protein